MPRLSVNPGRIARGTLSTLATLAAMLLPGIAASQPVFNGGGLVEGLAAAANVSGIAKGTLPGVIDDAIDRIVLYVGLAATIVIIMAGFYLIVGLGSDDSRDKAKKIILYTVIGIAIIFFARLIVDFTFEIISGVGNSGARTVITDIVKRILTYLALLATMTIVIAGFYLILGLGSDDSREKSKKIILYTLAGLAVILFCRVIVGFVTTILDQP
jgi:hypothetical protein